MKKLLVLLLILALSLTLFACGGGDDKGNSNEEKPEVVLEEMSAEDVIVMLQEAGFPIDNIIVYNEETDENGLLGRPGGYTSKVNAADTRVEQYSETDPSGISVEVFETNDLAKNRKEYIDGFSADGANMFSEYSYIQGGVLLRLDYDLTPSQAEIYEKALQDMSDGKKPTFTE